MSRLCVGPVLFGLFLLCAPEARGDDEPPIVLSGESSATGKRLAEARKLFAEREWSDGIAILQSVIDTGGNQLVAVDARRALRARRLAQVSLARLPPKARELYRLRAE